MGLSIVVKQFTGRWPGRFGESHLIFVGEEICCSVTYEWYYIEFGQVFGLAAGAVVAYGALLWSGPFVSAFTPVSLFGTDRASLCSISFFSQPFVVAFLQSRV